MSYFFVDVARLFRGKSLRIRRLVYIFVSRCGAFHPEKVLSVLEVIMNDLYSPNVHARTLSLKCMASLSSINFVADAFVAPLSDILKNDTNPLVKQTAVLCILSIFRKSHDLFEKHKLRDVLFDMFRIETDPCVLASVVLILMKTRHASSDVTEQPLSESEVTNMLYAMNYCSDTDQLSILRFLTLSKFSLDADAARVMSKVYPMLHTSNVALIVQISQFFLIHIASLESAQIDVCQSSEGYLRKLLNALLFHLESTLEPESMHYILQVIHMILHSSPSAASDLPISTLFLRFSESELVQAEKIQLLSFVANDSNALDILKELEEYTKDTYSMYVSSRTIFAMVEIGLALPSVNEHVLQKLLGIFHTTTSQAVLEGIIECAQYILRFSASDSTKDAIVKLIIESNTQCTQDDAKQSLLWIVGQVGDFENSHAILSRFLSNFSHESFGVHLALLTASVKFQLRFKDTANHEACFHLGQAILRKCTELDDPLLQDRAQFYADLLEMPVTNAHSIIFPAMASKPQSFPRHIHCKYQSLRPHTLIEDIDDLSLHAVVREVSALDSQKVKPKKAVRTTPVPANENDDSDSASVVIEDHADDNDFSFDDLFASKIVGSSPARKGTAEPRKSFDFGALFD